MLDELGYLPFAQAGGQLLFYLVGRLYEQTSVTVTTNLAFGGWPAVEPRGERRRLCVDAGERACLPAAAGPADKTGASRPAAGDHVPAIAEATPKGICEQ